VGGVKISFSKAEKQALSEYANNADEINASLTLGQTSINDIISAEQAHASATINQVELSAAVGPLVKAEGGDFSDPGPKTLAGIKKKMLLKGRVGSGINDAVRVGFTAHSPAQADVLADKIRARFPGSVDENWTKTGAGYFDRTIIVKFANGQKGEVQIWHPELIKLKNAGGHDMYDKWKDAPAGSVEQKYWASRMISLYSPVVRNLAPEWSSALAGMGSR